MGLGRVSTPGVFVKSKLALCANIVKKSAVPPNRVSPSNVGGGGNEAISVE
jgi:hypothetical protein